MSNVINAWYETPGREVDLGREDIKEERPASIDGCISIVGRMELYKPASIGIDDESIQITENGSSKRYVAVTRRTEDHPEDYYKNTCILLEDVDGWHETRKHHGNGAETRCIDPDLTVESGCKVPTVPEPEVPKPKRNEVQVGSTSVKGYFATGLNGNSVELGSGKSEEDCRNLASERGDKKLPNGSGSVAVIHRNSKHPSMPDTCVLLGKTDGWNDPDTLADKNKHTTACLDERKTIQSACKDYSDEFIQSQRERNIHDERNKIFETSIEGLTDYTGRVKKLYKLRGVELKTHKLKSESLDYELEIPYISTLPPNNADLVRYQKEYFEWRDYFKNDSSRKLYTSNFCKEGKRLMKSVNTNKAMEGDMVYESNPGVCVASGDFIPATAGFYDIGENKKLNSSIRKSGVNSVEVHTPFLYEVNVKKDKVDTFEASEIGNRLCRKNPDNPTNFVCTINGDFDAVNGWWNPRETASKEGYNYQNKSFWEFWK